MYRPFFTDGRRATRPDADPFGLDTIAGGIDTDPFDQFYKDRTLLGKLADCAKETLFEMFKVIFLDREYIPGVILSIQTSGDLMVWHPHCHCLVSDGCFDKQGSFHPNPEIDSNQAMIIFREKVFSMLKDNNRISDL